jgi:hypothetical protein
LFGADTSGLAQDYILYSGREVLPIGGFLGNGPAPTLSTLRSDIGRGYVRLFILPVSPSSPDPRVRWVESDCTEVSQGRPGQPIRLATFFCGAAASQPVAQPSAQPAAEPPPAGPGPS